MSTIVHMAEIEKSEKARYDCKICGLAGLPEHSYREHLRGRYHQRSLDKARKAEKSVYVKGFEPQTVTEGVLLHALEKFGPINTVWLNPAKVYAIVQFKSAASALNALQSPATAVLGRRLIIKPRTVKPFKNVRRHVPEEGDEHKSEEQQSAGADRGPTKRYDRCKLDQAVISLLEQSKSKSIEEQIEVLSQHNRMPYESIEAQLTLCHMLQLKLQADFPDCILIPFGAAVSGHGTVTSDCDVCLMTNPSVQMREIFSPSNYYPPKLLALWQEIISKQGGDGTPNAPSVAATPPPPVAMEMNDDDGDEQSNTSFSSASSSSPSPVQKQHKPPEFDKVLHVVYNLKEASRILPLSHARCPIIRFRVESMGLHCDLSINNRLGPLNTRLMQAYYNFDARFPLLVPIVRLWMKALGPPRNQLNNYAVSLMLIYALQHCNPPVLPCLQNPGAWPKNMAWFAEKGFSLASSKKGEDSIMVGGWCCDFTPPDSLLPSTNTETPASLLVHFFKFFSEFQNVVAIHCPPDKTLTVKDAIELATANTKGPQSGAGDDGAKRRGKFAVSAPLCVQDPFELNHNVVKGLSRLSFAELTNGCRLAAMILKKQMESDEGSLLAIFDRECYQDAAVQVPENLPSKVMLFAKEDVVALFDQTEELKVLAAKLDELDLSNKATLHSLCLVVLRTLVEKLKNGMSFVISQEADDETMEGGDPEEEVMQLEPSLMPQDDRDMEEEEEREITQEEGSTESQAAAATNETAVTTTVTVDLEKVSPISVQRKRQRSETEEETSVETGEITQEERSDPMLQTDGTTTTATAQADTSKEEEEEEEHVKRCKTDTEVAALDLLHQLIASGGAERYVCTAYHNSWKYNRKARRELARKLVSEAEKQPLLLPTLSTPVIQVSFTLVPVDSILYNQRIDGKICAVQLNPLKVNDMKEYAKWFAIFRKLSQCSSAIY